MSAVDEILGSIPLGQLAAQLGTDESTAEAAARSALPALLGGLHANAQDPAGAASLTEALGQHSPSLVEGGVDLNQVDVSQGEQIVNHVFGGNTESVVNELGATDPGAMGLSQNVTGALGSGTMQRLLPILAPIVMSYLARQAGRAGAQGQDPGAVGGMLGSVLSGMGGGGGQGGTGGIVSDVLGGLLGGGRR